MKFFITLLVFISMTSLSLASDDRAVAEETNFQKLAEQMKSNKMGLVMMLHAEDCPFCKLMDERILSPMIRSGEYKNKVFIRKLQIDKPEYITDFNGERVLAPDLADEYDSQLTPTLVFLDQSGDEKALNIIGINSLDYFGAAVDEQIDELLAVIRK